MSITIIMSNNPKLVPILPDVETLYTCIVLWSVVRTQPSLDISNCQLKQPVPKVKLNYTKAGKKS